ncbi:MAG: hypothetical protein GTO40_07715 [Deltaproteobacteria bacterium]|nr:hypothetical protein [Deltaproteobacteria bacterium]
MEEYQISPRETRWCTPQLHHWETGATDHEEVDPKDGMAVQWMDKDGQDSFQLLESALLEGQLDAIGTTGLPAAFVRGQSGIKRLFDNYRDEEIFYFRKTKIFPIMHILVVRKSAVEQDPDLPHKLFTLFVQSKREAQERLKRDFSLSIVWKTPYLEQEEDLFEGDPWAYGLSKNTPAIEKFLQYCYKQGVSARMMDPRDLFAPATWEFTEESVLAES